MPGSPPSSSIESVHQKYMSSPGHRAKILDAGFTHLGVGVAHGDGLTYTVLVFTTR